MNNTSNMDNLLKTLLVILTEVVGKTQTQGENLGVAIQATRKLLAGAVAEMLLSGNQTVGQLSGLMNQPATIAFLVGILAGIFIHIPMRLFSRQASNQNDSSANNQTDNSQLPANDQNDNSSVPDLQPNSEWQLQCARSAIQF